MADDPIVIKFGNTVAFYHPNILAALKFAEIMATRTNGRVKVEAFPAAQLATKRNW